MSDPRLTGSVNSGERIWSFADCTFDELNWTLTVAGKRVRLESKPLEVLRALLVTPGQVVSKAELLDAIWPNVAVVEASLPTAVRKLRVALGDDRRNAPIIETVSRIGYRLNVDVTLASSNRTSSPSRCNGLVRQSLQRPRRSKRAIGSAVLIGMAGLAMIGASAFQHADNKVANPSPLQINRAIRSFDLTRIEMMIDAGLDVNKPLDRYGAVPLTVLLEVCEWNPDHDRKKMLLVARALFDAGAKLDQRNAFGDTPYSIAKAPRYCGPDHPVTVMMRNLCFNNGDQNALRDRCLASYEIARLERAKQLATKKAPQFPAAPFDVRLKRPMP